MDEEVKRNDIGNMLFASGYISEYRYLKQVLLEKEHDDIQDVFSNLKQSQHENLRQMIEIEMIINAVQYCGELAAFAICVKNKNLLNFMKIISSLPEASIKDFFDKVMNADEKLLFRYMGYHEIDIKYEDIGRYIRSCKRYQEDILILSEFYNRWYNLYTAYKHGLRIIPSFNEKNGKKIIMEACKDNTMTIYEIPEMWWLKSIEITETIKKIYAKLYVPLIKLKLSDFLNISLDNDSISTSIESTELPDPNRPISFSSTISLPWWIHEPRTPNPFY
ncbi:hypothetical protein J7W08_06685 [Methanococcoides orientis]|uniref:hypothetical protein n=1 Tax=Methanococcoides orientis TaxID=2822137 RepID=UPI001E4F6E95|nr:hypothetical protein [Methanococcoides orientis]UGV39817.1 hypothetical protein J7W08_06685 [Methanococcoides orientis]